jgi:hypothetical protein
MAVPLHATTGLLIGCDLAETKSGLAHKRFFQIMLVPVLLHGFYDLATMLGPAVATVTGIAWFQFTELFAIVIVIVGILYGKKRRQQILNLNTSSYQPVVAIPV